MTVETLAAASETTHPWISMRLPPNAAARTSGMVSEVTVKSQGGHLVATLVVRDRVQAVALLTKLAWCGPDDCSSSHG